MRIVHVASEVTPWSQTGGLADVAGALPKAQRAAGDDAIVVSPLYRCVRDRAHQLGAALQYIGVEFELKLGQTTQRVRVVTIDHVAAAGMYFVDAPDLYDRVGLYTDEHHHEYHDNSRRFAVLAKAAVQMASIVMASEPDVFHAHDWQAGLVPLYVREADGSAATVFTLHNLAYQGVFAKQAMTELGLDWSLFNLQQLELHDRVSFLKGGVSLAHVVTTVSPSYAREVTTVEHGFGLHAFLSHNARGLTGIVNGIDTASWDPRTDEALVVNYDADDVSGKAACRAALADEIGFESHPDELLCGIVSRFAHQKGLDLVAALAPHLVRLGARVVVLGTGDHELESQFRELARQPHGRISAVINFDAQLARRIYAGCDAILMPSRFEPCGLNQLYAMRYGAVPIVRSVGGLRDTVVDPGDDELAAGRGTGFCFEDPDANGLRWAVGRAARFFRDRKAGWQQVVEAGMSRDSSWKTSADRYRAVYDAAIMAE